MSFFKMHPEVKRVIDDYAEGDLVNGTVIEFTPFGAYIDVQGLKAKLNREEISWSQIGSADHFLTLGQDIRCVVLAADGETGKFIVGIRQSLPDPWACGCRIPARGDVIRGCVISVFEADMIVETSSGIHGRVRVRDCIDRYGKMDLPSHFRRGGIYEFLVIRVDSKRGALDVLPMIDSDGH